MSLRKPGLARARNTLGNARHDLSGGYYDGAINRSYYATLYAAVNILDYFEIPVTSDHRKNVTALKGLLKTGRGPDGQCGELMWALLMERFQVDYERAGQGLGDEEENQVSDLQQAEEAVQMAEEFISLVERWLESFPEE